MQTLETQVFVVREPEEATILPQKPKNFGFPECHNARETRDGNRCRFCGLYTGPSYPTDPVGGGPRAPSLRGAQPAVYISL